VRALVVLTIVAAAMVAGEARAEISADLKFCAGLKVSKERLACYDAAARLERSHPVVVQEPVAIAQVSPVRTKPRPSRFAGAYVGGFGGYDVAVNSPGTGSSYVPFTSPDSMQGAFAGGLVGYNVVEGSLLFGVEARGRYSFGKAEDSAPSPFNSVRPFPIHISSCFGSGCGSGPFSPDWEGQPIVAATKYTSLFKRPYSADLSFRSGFVFNDWLLYGRGGAGIEKTTSVFISDDSKSRYCNSPVYKRTQVSTDAFDTFVVGCGSTSGGLITTTQVYDGFAPVLSVGVGIERNFDAFFLRAEAELLGHFLPHVTNSFYYTPAANFAIGYRFSP
jgi:hypothetical protein